jgi:hypothetical protein
MFYVKSVLKYFERTHGHERERENGELGPFEKRETAERALVALCQAGQATSGEIAEHETEETDKTLKHVAEVVGHVARGIAP